MITAKNCFLAARRLLVASAVGFSPVLQADTIFGLFAGAHMWQPSLEGTIGQSDNGFDVSGEFNGGDSDSLSLYLAVEHFVPLIPNVLVRTTPINWTGNSESASGTLGGTITVNGEVNAEFDVDLQDATLYYELLDNWASIDLGLTVRRLDGFAQVTEVNTELTDSVDLTTTIPMLYGHVRFDLPFTGLAAGIRGNGISFQESNLVDLEAYVHLEVDLFPAVDFGIQGGFRSISLDIEDLEQWNSDATLEGAYIGLTAHF